MKHSTFFLQTKVFENSLQISIYINIYVINLSYSKNLVQLRNHKFSKTNCENNFSHFQREKLLVIKQTKADISNKLFRKYFLLFFQTSKKICHWLFPKQFPDRRSRIKGFVELSRLKRHCAAAGALPRAQQFWLLVAGVI